MRKTWRWALIGAFMVAIVGASTGVSTRQAQGWAPMPDTGIPYVFVGEDDDDQGGNGLAGSTLASALAASRVGGADGNARFIHGCWFRPPAPPSCASCADNCNPGQNCCIILPI
jgi:hypothetical protein